MWIDSNASHQNQATEFEENIFYGELVELLAHEFRGQRHEIALVRCFKNLECDRYGLFHGKPDGPDELFETHELMAIPVDLLDGLVGAVKNTERRRTFILDTQLTITVPGYIPHRELP